MMILNNSVMTQKTKYVAVVGVMLLTLAWIGQVGRADSSPLSVSTTDTTGGWIGHPAPVFTLPSSQGSNVDTGKAFGTRPVVLIFYRGIWCPFCQAQMTQIGKDRDAFIKSGAVVYAISDEAPAAQKAMQDAHHLDFITFLSDKTGMAARQYAGVYTGRTTLKPAVFVIGRDKKVKYAYINENFRLRAADQDVLAAVRSASH
jgi:peroxiredoxin